MKLLRSYAEASQPRDCREPTSPDDYYPLMPRRNPEDIDLGAIKNDLEFLIERVSRLRKEQALKLLYTMIGSAAIVIALPPGIARGAPPLSAARVWAEELSNQCRDTLFSVIEHRTIL